MLSKLEIVEQAFITFSRGCGIDRIMAKGCLYAKLRLAPNHYIHVFNTHTQASYKEGTDDDLVNQDVRRAQISEMRAFFAGKTLDFSPVVLLGDFNVVGGSKEYDEMMKLLTLPGYSLSDVLKERLGEHPITYGDTVTSKDGNLVPIEPLLTVKDDHGKPQRLDYIFVLHRDDALTRLDVMSAAVQQFYIRDQPFRQLSDHYGVEMTVRLTSSTRKQFNE